MRKQRGQFVEALAGWAVSGEKAFGKLWGCYTIRALSAEIDHISGPLRWSICVCGE